MRLAGDQKQEEYRLDGRWWWYVHEVKVEVEVEVQRCFVVLVQEREVYGVS